MKQKISEKIKVPKGVICEYSNGILKCKSGSKEISKEIAAPQLEVKIAGNEITIEYPKGNKKNKTVIFSILAHLRNLFQGLGETYTYHLESCNVHFPMTLKVEGDKLTINNFLGEKTPRHAKILPGVKVEIKGQQISIISSNKEFAGQTAANFEKATKVRGRDRRIYQDGIFITKKPIRFSQENN